MTRFQRKGHWRNSVYGTRHRVSEHLVERDDWSRGGPSEPDTDAYYAARTWLAGERADGSATARFVNPNAECPVCGQAVFFYRNEHGSRVYFDELGPPWPKHPCTDHPARRTFRTSRACDQASPSVRYEYQIASIDRWLATAGLDRSSEFKDKYGSGQWEPWQIEKRFKAPAGVILVVRSIGRDTDKRRFLVCQRLPRAASRDVLVFLHRERFQYFDLMEMVPIEVTVRRLPTASAFVEALVARGPDIQARAVGDD